MHLSHSGSRSDRRVNGKDFMDSSDDEDFELNELLNRHFRVAMSIVDDYEDPPELKKDIFWNLTEPELIENPEIIDVLDTDKIEVEVKQECNNVYHHHITNGGCKDTLL